jgi:hypothetical protein
MNSIAPEDDRIVACDAVICTDLDRFVEEVCDDKLALCSIF